ncbi:glycoside hydrolase superfamily [Aspergillus fruticulosus]
MSTSLAEMSTVDEANRVLVADLVKPGSQKAALLSGSDFVRSTGVSRLGIPRLKESAPIIVDSINGVKGSDIHHGTPTAVFPSSTLYGATRNNALMEELGAALAEQAKLKSAQVILGPTINIHRDPRGRRNLECFSEDPFLSGQLAAAIVRGIQSNGVAACPKHLVCNESEFKRREYDVVEDWNGRTSDEPERSEIRRETNSLALKIASEGIVLLKNEHKVLPLDMRCAPRIAVIGVPAIEPIISGRGSASAPLQYVQRPLDCTQNAHPIPALMDEARLQYLAVDVEVRAHIMTALQQESSVEHGLLPPEESDFPSVGILEHFLGLFSEHVHPRFPTIHQPTFATATAPPYLLLAMMLLGSSHSASNRARFMAVYLHPVVMMFSRMQALDTAFLREIDNILTLLFLCVFAA